MSMKSAAQIMHIQRHELAAEICRTVAKEASNASLNAQRWAAFTPRICCARSMRSTAALNSAPERAVA